MHRLNELAARLTPAQVNEVEDFAEFLLSRKRAPATPATVDRNGQEHLSPAAVEAAAALLAGLAPDRTSVELQHEALEARANED
jgi:hypothetical protein